MGFTYQGHLTDANLPANGFCDFEFKLFDAPADGNQVGPTLSFLEVFLDNGYFTVELDFISDDPNAFQPQGLDYEKVHGLPYGKIANYQKIWGGGEGRWLEIAVRPALILMNEPFPDDQPLAYTILSPRTKITPTPYALYALSSGTRPQQERVAGTDNYIPRWLGTTGLEDSVIYQAEYTDNVGIGTTDPARSLDVSGTIKTSGYADGTWTTAGWGKRLEIPTAGVIQWLKGAGNTISRGIGFTTNDTMYFIRSADNVVGTANYDMAIDKDGNVGIGTTTPTQKLDVSQGNIVLSETGGTMHYIMLQRNGSNIGSMSTANGRITIGAESGYDAMIQNSSGAGIILKNSSGNVGIGTTSPGAKLEINGQIKITGGLPGAGKVLTSDATGLATWQTVSGGGDGGNLGNHTATQNIKMNGYWLSGDGGNEGIYVDNRGYVGIGTNDLQGYDLRVNGYVCATGSVKCERVEAASLGLDANYYVRPEGWSCLNHLKVKGQISGAPSLNVDGAVRFQGLTAGGGQTVVVDNRGDLWKSSSSKRYKSHIEDLKTDSDAVLNLRPVRFQWTSTGQEEIGLIAEEVAESMSDLVIYDAEGRPDAVKYDKLSLYLLTVVKELKSENDSLKQRLDTLEKKIENIENHSSSILKEVLQ
jgi:hypothetical protein